MGYGFTVHWQATHNDALIVESGQALQLSELDSLHYFNQLQALLLQKTCNYTI